MNKTHVEVLKNQISEKKSKGETKMTPQEYLMNRELIDNQLENMQTS